MQRRLLARMVALALSAVAVYAAPGESIADNTKLQQARLLAEHQMSMVLAGYAAASNLADMLLLDKVKTIAHFAKGAPVHLTVRQISFADGKAIVSDLHLPFDVTQSAASQGNPLEALRRSVDRNVFNTRIAVACRLAVDQLQGIVDGKSYTFHAKLRELGGNAVTFECEPASDAKKFETAFSRDEARLRAAMKSAPILPGVGIGDFIIGDVEYRKRWLYGAPASEGVAVQGGKAANHFARYEWNGGSLLIYSTPITGIINGIRLDEGETFWNLALAGQQVPSDIYSAVRSQMSNRPRGPGGAGIGSTLDEIVAGFGRPASRGQLPVGGCGLEGVEDHSLHYEGMDIRVCGVAIDIMIRHTSPVPHLVDKFSNDVANRVTNCLEEDPASKEFEPIFVKVKIGVRFDGTVKDAQTLTQPQMWADPKFRTAANRVLHAVRRCQLNLPSDQYENWKELTILVPVR